MDARNYPTWRDFDIPQGLVEVVKHLGRPDKLGFLVNDRVFRLENKINYQYECLRCGHSKIVTRQYEDYSSCDKCRSESVHGIPFWKECRNSDKAEINLDVSKIINQMNANHFHYFGEFVENIASVRWDKNCFTSKFIGGEEVHDVSPVRSVAKAAILCPYLWDNNFNWCNKIKNDRGNDLHVSHLIMQWAM